MAKRSVNLKALAEHLGLSQTTVSRALNGFPEVSEATRARVQAAAEKLDYRPNPSAASLATGKARQIGHVVPLADHTMINPHFSDFIAAAGEVYAEHKYDMLFRVVHPRDEAGVYRDYASRKRVDGVVVHGPVTGDPRIPLLRELGLPFVVHGSDGGTATDYSWVDVDNKRCFRKATRLLLAKGHKRIGLVNGLTAMNFASERLAGFTAAMEGAGYVTDPGLIHSADMDEPYGYRATRDMMALTDPPTALLYASILPALGGVRALNELGCLPGRDIDIITYDDQLSFLTGPDGATGSMPYFTSIRSSIREAGRIAAQMLLSQIERGDTTPTHVLLEPRIVIGRTTSGIDG